MVLRKHSWTEISLNLTNSGLSPLSVSVLHKQSQGIHSSAPPPPAPVLLNTRKIWYRDFYQEEVTFLFCFYNFLNSFLVLNITNNVLNIRISIEIWKYCFQNTDYGWTGSKWFHMQFVTMKTSCLPPLLNIYRTNWKPISLLTW